jgi:hypothetical protein
MALRDRGMDDLRGRGAKGMKGPHEWTGNADGDPTRERLGTEEVARRGLLKERRFSIVNLLL